jgi:predicted regulator of Ras-like GTPase activity (Roadblock/LC7/MglB family)
VYRVDLLEQTLAELCGAVQGARAAVIVSVEGFVVASFPAGDELFVESGSADSSQVAAMASTLLSLSERTLSRLEMGEEGVERLLIEGKQGSMIVTPVSERAALALLLDKETKIGVALFMAQRSTRQVQDILEGQSQPPGWL